MLATAAVLALVVVVAAVSAGSVLLAAGRAQDAADAAALAAAHARHEAVTPVAAAAAAAARYGGTLVGCDCAAAVVAVTVRVPVSARPARLLGIIEQHASARARLVPAAGDPGWPGRRGGRTVPHRGVRSPHDPIAHGNVRPT